MRRLAGKWLLIAIGGGLFLTGVTWAAVVWRQSGSAPGEPTQLASSSSCSTSGPTFCVYSSAPGPTLYPGAPPSSLPVTFGNPMSVPIYVTSLTVNFTNAFPSGCLPSWFQLAGSSLSDAAPQTTINLATPLAVPAGSADSPGTAQYAPTLALANVNQNQDACKNLPLTMSYSARAYYTVQTSTSLRVSASGSGSSQSLTLNATVAPGITPTSAGSTPSGTVEFFDCSSTAASSCTAQIGSASLSGGSASLNWAPTASPTNYLEAVYVPSDSTAFAGSSSGVFTQTTAPLPYAQLTMSYQPLAYWRLGDAFDQSGLSDNSGHGWGGEYKNGASGTAASPQAVYGVSGDGTTAAIFTGDGTYAYVNGLAAPQHAYSINLWFYPLSTDAQSLFQQGGAGAVWINSSGQLAFRQVDNFASSELDYTLPAGFKLNSWHQVVTTWDGSTAQLYLDGQLHGSKATAAPVSGAGTIYLGYGTFAPWFSGYMSEAAYFDHALTASDVAAQYAADPPLYLPTSAVQSSAGGSSGGASTGVGSGAGSSSGGSQSSGGSSQSGGGSGSQSSGGATSASSGGTSTGSPGGGTGSGSAGSGSSKPTQGGSSHKHHKKPKRHKKHKPKKHKPVRHTAIELVIGF